MSLGADDLAVSGGTWPEQWDIQGSWLCYLGQVQIAGVDMVPLVQAERCNLVESAQAGMLDSECQAAAVLTVYS